jgi:transcriptional regulator with XRE-family HTH domain
MNASWEAIELRMQERGVGTLSRLAEMSGNSVKSLTRIKQGRASNATTIERIAKALGVETAALCQPPDEARKREAMERLEKEGYREIPIPMDRSTRLAYRLVSARYKVRFDTLVKLGPLFAVAMFEKCLAARRARLDAFREAFDAALAAVPSHLPTPSAAISGFEEAYGLEERSIASNDLTGPDFEALAHLSVEDDIDEVHPFAEFLSQFASDLAPDLIEITCVPGGSLADIDYSVLAADLDNLTNGDERALFALEHEYGRVTDMPADVRSSSDPAERARWLADRVPNDVWAAEEKRRSDFLESRSHIKL